jgi:hypothetical protein
MKIVPVILSGGVAHTFGHYHARNTPKSIHHNINLADFDV